MSYDGTPMRSACRFGGFAVFAALVSAMFLWAAWGKLGVL